MTGRCRGDLEQVSTQLEKVPARRLLVVVSDCGDLRVMNRKVDAGTSLCQEMKRRHVRALQFEGEIHY
jgi:hypothetical protein